MQNLPFFWPTKTLIIDDNKYLLDEIQEMLRGEQKMILPWPCRTLCGYCRAGLLPWLMTPLDDTTRCDSRSGVTLRGAFVWSRFQWPPGPDGPDRRSPQGSQVARRRGPGQYGHEYGPIVLPNKRTSPPALSIQEHRPALASSSRAAIYLLGTRAPKSA